MAAPATKSLQKILLAEAAFPGRAIFKTAGMVYNNICIALVHRYSLWAGGLHERKAVEEWTFRLVM